MGPLLRVHRSAHNLHKINRASRSIQEHSQSHYKHNHQIYHIKRLPNTSILHKTYEMPETGCIKIQGMVHSLKLSVLSTNKVSLLNILWHDCDPLHVDGTQVGILKQAHEVGLRCLLEGHYGMVLKA